MFDDLRDLYQEVIFDHNRNPRNFRIIENADRKVEGFNPLCGDRLTLYLKMAGNVITDASFQGSGCAISTASVSGSATSSTTTGLGCFVLLRTFFGGLISYIFLGTAL